MIEALPYRIRVGVTGHRSLDDAALLRKTVDNILTEKWIEAFDEDSQKLLRSSPIAFTVVSPLAEGADRLVAEAVMNLPNSRLEVPLPLRYDDYIKDFVSPESRHHFEELFLRAVVVSEPSLPNESILSRNDEYRQSGERVVEQSDFLIAIWNGQPSQGIGGTAEIVEYAQSKGKPVFTIKTSIPDSFELRKAGTLIAKGLAGLNRYNSTEVQDTSQAMDELQTLFETSEGMNIPSIYRDLAVRHIFPHYAKASAQALSNQKRYQKTGMLAYVVSTLSVACLAIAVVFTSSSGVSTTCYIMELLALGFLFVMIHKANKAKVHEHWLENRALAERLRSTLFYVACGIRPAGSDAEVEGEYPVNWISRAIAEIRYGLTLPDNKSLPGLADRESFLRSAWIQDQCNYHRNKAARCLTLNNRLKSISLWLFGASFIVSAIHLSSATLALIGHEPGYLIKLVEEVLTVVAVTLPAAAAAVGGYRILMEYPRITSRSSAMAVRLVRLEKSKIEIDTEEKLAHLLVQIEEIMLAESRDWVDLMTHADLERIA